jgi:hypothetical protein
MKKRKEAEAAWSTFWRNYYGFRVMLVDGEWVRNNIYIDFVAGGNPQRYTFVPEDEIWIEKNLGELERRATLVHEAAEHRMMSRGFSYSVAHDLASFFELRYRMRHWDLFQVRKPTTEAIRRLEQIAEGRRCV